MKKVSDIFKSIRFAKVDPEHLSQHHKGGSTDDEEHGAIGEVEWGQQVKHAKHRAGMENGMKEEIELDEAAYHDADWVEKSARHERLYAYHKRMGNEAEAAKHKAEIDKLYKKEETEQLDEISKETLKSYIPKAMGSKSAADFMRGVKMAQGTGGEEELRKKSEKRSAGIHTAIKKLTKEELEETTSNNQVKHVYGGSKDKKIGEVGKDRDGNWYAKHHHSNFAASGFKSRKEAENAIHAQHYATVNEEVELEEGKMGDLHAEIGRHLDNHIADFKSGHTGMDQFGKKVMDAHKKVAQSTGLEHKHAVKHVNDYVDSKLNEDVEQIDEISKMTSMEYLVKSGKQIDAGISDKQKREKRIDGYFNASSRLAGLKPTSWRHKSVKEESEMDEAWNQPDYSQSIKARQEKADAENLPFKPDVKKTKPSTPGKYGSGYSTARHLARMAARKAAGIKEETLEEGRPSQRHPLEDHDYHKKSNDELVHIAKDAHAAAEAMKSHNTTAENKYRDQANDSATVRHWRKMNGMPNWYKKKYGHMNESKDDLPFEPDDKKKPSAKTGKYGSEYSTVRHLARQALKKQSDKLKSTKTVKESLEESRRTDIIRQAAKKGKDKNMNKDKFEADPELSSEIIK